MPLLRRTLLASLVTLALVAAPVMADTLFRCLCRAYDYAELFRSCDLKCLS